MRLSFNAPIEVTERQVLKIRANWERISRFGMAAFVFGAGTVFCLWMCLCFVAFSHFYGTQKILRDPFVIKSTLPCFAFLSYFSAVVYYLMVKLTTRRTRSV